MKSRNIQDWASIAEIVSAIAVVTSLIYVAYEINQNTKAQEASTRQAFAEQDQTFLASVLDPSVLAKAQQKLETGDQLTELEHSQLVHRQHLNFRIFENAHYQYEKGALDSSQWQRYENITRAVYCSEPTAREMWASFKRGFEASFRRFVEEINCNSDET